MRLSKMESNFVRPHQTANRSIDGSKLKAHPDPHSLGFSLSLTVSVSPRGNFWTTLVLKEYQLLGKRGRNPLDKFSLCLIKSHIQK